MLKSVTFVVILALCFMIMTEEVVCCRNAISPVEAAHNRWREGHHPKPNRSSEVRHHSILLHA